MKLLGQTVRASKLLLETHREAQEKIGKPIIFLDITTHRSPATRQARGHHDSVASTECIWLDPELPYHTQEAVAAHELMHVLQEAGGFYQTASLRDDQGNPLIPAITWLGTTINSMIMDEMADRWAISRGFKVKDELRIDVLPRALADVKSKKPNEQEHMNWQEYYADMERIAQVISSGLPIHGPIVLKPEALTQIRGVHYAGLRLRLSRFGLFSELDSVWAELWPEARSLGQDVANIAEGIGVDDRRACESSMIAVIEYLNINPRLLCVKLLLTGEVIWPEQK